VSITELRADLAHVPPGGERVVWAFLLYPHRMVLSPRAGYRIRKKTGRAVNRTIKQTKTAISILLSQCLATDRGFRRPGSLTYDTRASGPQFNRVTTRRSIHAVSDVTIILERRQRGSRTRIASHKPCS
jgi:hypothetical protein